MSFCSMVPSYAAQARASTSTFRSKLKSPQDQDSSNGSVFVVLTRTCRSAAAVMAQSVQLIRNSALPSAELRSKTTGFDEGARVVVVGLVP